MLLPARQALADARLVARVILRHGFLWNSPRAIAQLVGVLSRGRRDPFVPVSFHAIDRPRTIAVSDESTSLDYGALHDVTGRVAGGLLALGVRSRDRVGIVSANRVEYFVVMGAVMQLGAIPVPLSPHAAPPELLESLVQARVSAVVVERHLAAASLDAVQQLGHDPSRVVHLPSSGGEVEVDADTTPWSHLLDHAPADITVDKQRYEGDGPDMLVYTSGTTGQARGTRLNLRKANFVAAFRYLDVFDIRRGDVFFTPCPLYHAAPFILTGLALTAGAQSIVHRKFDAQGMVDELKRSGATHAFLVPTLLERLARLPDRELRSLRGGPLRVMLSGGGPLRPATKTRLLQQLGPVLHDFYGATEFGVVCIATPDDLTRKPATVGRLIPGVQMKLLDDDGHEVPTGQPGELFVQGDANTDGYEGDPEETARWRRGDWVSAGDIATVDEEGLIYIVDRKKDMVVSGGVNVFPAEVEKVLDRHPSVRECSVVGIPDDEWGESLQAFIVLEPGAELDEAALREHCDASLARYKRPKGFHVIDELPRNPTGKVFRRKLVARLLNQ